MEVYNFQFDYLGIKNYFIADHDFDNINLLKIHNCRTRNDMLANIY